MRKGLLATLCGIALGWGLSIPAAVAEDASEAAARSGVQLLLIEGIRGFPEATEAGAVRFACAGDSRALEKFFAERGAAFRPALLRRRNGLEACHVFYEPSLPGFRALPDGRQIVGVAGGIDPASLVGGRKRIGDSLDVARDVLSRIRRPLDVTFSLTGEFDRSYWPAAMARAFPDSPHRFTLIESEAHSTHPWGQDFVKSGVADGKPTVLVPRRLFEGRGEDGDLYRPMLEAMKDGPYVRSKLSWEGGDLQFIADPKDPSRTILFHGGSSREYWGAQLEREEASYVLQVEFGADSAVDMSTVGPHADFLVGFLPAEKTVLVADPVHGDLGLALAAARELVALYGDRTPADLEAVEELLTQANGPDPSLASLEHVRARIPALLESLPKIESPVPLDLQKRLETHQALHCPEDATQCYLGEGKRVMLREDPELLRAVYDAAADSQIELAVANRFLRLIESQLPNFPETMSARIDAQATTIRRLGFRVIRVPYLYSPEAMDEWPGISYANSLLIDRTLFVPAAGLGKAEEKIFRDLRNKLPPGYEVVPVHARFSLMKNGGVHCVFGLIRDPDGVTAGSDGS